MAKTETFWVGSLWHQYNDPFVTVIATTQEAAQAKLDELENDEFELMKDQAAWSEEDPEEVESDIMTGGLFPESLEDVQQMIEMTDSTKVHDLEEDGIAVI